MSRIVTIISIVLLALITTQPTASAQPAATGTAEVIFYADTVSVEVPVREGFYNGAVINRYSGEYGEGFGYNKAKDRHNVWSIGLIRWILEDNNRVLDVGPQTEGTNDMYANRDEGLNFFKKMEKVHCVEYQDIPSCGTEGPFDIVAAVNLENRPLYYDKPASVPSSEFVGLQTVFCEGYGRSVDYKCPDWVNRYLIDA